MTLTYEQLIQRISAAKSSIDAALSDAYDAQAESAELNQVSPKDAAMVAAHSDIARGQLARLVDELKSLR